MIVIIFIVVFHSSYPNDIANIEWDEIELRAKIDKAIENLTGIRATPFTPHMAFENIVKEEIKRLEEPILACIDAVVELLLEAVRRCTKSVSYLYCMNQFPNIQLNQIKLYYIRDEFVCCADHQFSKAET